MINRFVFIDLIEIYFEYYNVIIALQKSKNDVQLILAH